MSGVVAAFAIGGAAISVSVSPPSASGGGTSGGFVPGVTASVAGGDGSPVAWAWSILSSDYPLTPTSPTSATTAFNFTGVGAGELATGIALVTATQGASTASAEVIVQFQNRDRSGGVQA